MEMWSSEASTVFQKTWPYFRLIPADNTSGPFPLPKPVSGSGTIDVKVLSWDERRGVWAGGSTGALPG